jgi:recombination protein RecR
MHDAINTLTDLLRELPGIGPRQARRLAFWFVRRERGWVERFAESLVRARSEIASCSTCMRLFPSDHGTTACAICRNQERDQHTLLIVEKDMDLENIERTGVYRGRYFVLGGTTSPLDKEPERKVRIRELLALIDREQGRITEVIFALSATTEGEDTVAFLTDQLRPRAAEHSFTLTLLGRGLSTGTELEYVDRDTLKSALDGRH